MSFNWLGLLQLISLWLLIVIVSIFILDWLFPRLRRGDDTTTPRNDSLPWYPVAPRMRTLGEGQPKGAPSMAATPFDPAYWRINLRIIIFLLAFWIFGSVGVVWLAPWLNQFQILTGFPLGYYMSSQGSLLIFLGVIAAYIWRMSGIDQKFSPPQVAPVENQKRMAIIFLVFTISFLIFVWLLGMFETQFNLSPNIIGWALLFVTLGVYAVIGLTTRANSLDDYFVAGRRIPAFFNGMAIAGDWMSAASFISMAGTLWLLGYEGLAYIIGWTGGYVLLAMLLAPYLRKFGQFTIPDFVAARYEGQTVRVIAAIIGVMISFTYVTAQVTGVGIIMSRFLGVNYIVGVIIGLGAVLFCSYLGGMRAITWTQVAQCIILLIAYLVPVTILSLNLTGIPFPQLMYGEALKNIVQLEAIQGITNSYITPFNDWTIWNFLALMLCLMLGTAGMPHILTRFYTVPHTGAARQSVGWALLFISLLYFTAPAYAAFSRWEILQNVVGKPIQAIPEWALNWSNAGLLTFSDLNGDGKLQFDELKIDPDLVVLATPEIAGLPHTVAVLVAAGGLAAALSTADGLLMVIASALSHDIYARIINPTASPRTRLMLGRLMIFVAAVLAAVVATRRLAIIVQLVSWAFSFAASTFFPILVLGIFWKRANGRGVVAGMITGLAATLTYMVLNALDPNLNILGITNVAAGVFGIPVNFLVTILVSKFTSPPSIETQALAESLRQP